MKYLSLVLLCATCFGQIVDDACELTISTPSLQERVTRKLRLDNGLEALLISDPGAIQSGAALAVNVGSWDDPHERPGMAHFVEHLLFLGTHKYPEEEGYTRYLDEHGGQRNAFTMTDRTVYFFSVNHPGFDEALDRFGHFFIDPLFNPSGVQRECNAIHQEYCKDIPLDPWRLHYVKKQLCSEDHPFHRFCIGNLQTLAQISQDELKEWYQTHYGAQLMHLVIVSSQSIDELEDKVNSLFSQVKRGTFSPEATLPPLIGAETAGLLLAVSPLQQLQILELAWEIPAQDLDTRSDRLVGHLLGHECEGSLFSMLKSAGYADQLSAGSSRAGKEQMTFSISVGLTDRGLKEYDKVIGMVFQVLARYRLTGVPRSIFDEVKQCQTLLYRYQSRQDTAQYVSDLATNMVDEPLETFPQLSLIPSRYDNESIDTLLAGLTPERCLFTLMAPPEKTRFKPDRKEPWFNVDYTVKQLSQKKLKNWAMSAPHPMICLPPPNPYLPEGLDLIDQVSELTTPLRLEGPGGVCYVQTDQEYQVPQIAWTITIKTPAIHPGNPKSLVLADLFCHTLEQRLNATAYLAQLGGLQFAISPVHNGLQLTVQGFHDKAHLFLKEVLTALATTSPTKEEFEPYCNLARRIYGNHYTKSPVAEAGELLWALLYRDYAGSVQKERVLKTLTYDEMKKFSRSLFHQTYVEAMLYGNMTQEEATEVWATIQQPFNHAVYDKNNHVKKEVANLDAVHLLNHQTMQQGNAVILAADLGEFSFQRRGAMDILCKGLEEPFFSELRTKQQTAYLVRNWGEEIERHLYAFFVIQSSSHDTRDLLSRFELFLESNVRHLEKNAIPRERFETIRTALIDRLKHPADNLLVKGQLLNRLAFEYEGDFSWLDKRIEALESLTYETFLELAQDFLGSDQPKRLAICVNGQIPVETGVHYQALTSPDKLRKQIEYKGKGS